ncbi:hypothetical protein D3C80_1931450 [compost metagenome]
MWRARIHDGNIIAKFNVVNILHLQRYDTALFNDGFVRSVNSDKGLVCASNANVLRKGCDTTATITAHRTLIAISIIIYHTEIVAFCCFQQHKAVCADAEAAIAEKINLLRT